MSEVNTTAETKEVKQPSKTDSYKAHLQKMIYNQLGVKVSKDKAWNLFKDIINGTVEFVQNQEDKSLPLAGVGTFEIMETKPRGSKAGLDKDGNPIEGAEAWPCVPRFKFYPSTVIDKVVESAYGLGNHGDLDVKHYGIYAPDAEPVKKEGKKAKAEKPADAVEEAEDIMEEVVDEVKEAIAEAADDLPGLDDL